MPSTDGMGPRLSSHVEFLASDECGGRAPGSVGGRLARLYVTERFEALDLTPAGEAGFHQTIPAPGGANVIGLVEGVTDPGRFVVLSAHYDHLGRVRGHTFPGADDNAAAVAVLIETARQLTNRSTELGRSVLVCSFDAEEPPFFLTREMGSVHFVAHPTVPLDRIDLMVNMDLVGHPLGPTVLPGDLQEGIIVYGELGRQVADLMAKIRMGGIRPWRMPMSSTMDLSDHYAFRRAGIPWLFLTTGRDRRYHTPRDTSEHVDVARLGALTAYLTEFLIDASQVDSTSGDAWSKSDYRTAVEAVDRIWNALPIDTQDRERGIALIQHLSDRLEAVGQLATSQVRSLESLLFRIEGAVE